MRVAVTSLYCAYHDIIRGGQYVWVVKAMHERYGPVVRIGPDIVHVNDPSFIKQLYPQSPHSRRERAQTVLNMFNEHLSVLPTRDHHLHRQRRAVLSPFFSQQNVRRLVPVINDTLAELFIRMDGWAKDGKPMSFDAACKAATKDVIQVYALGDGERCLAMEDLNAPFFKILNAERLSHIAVHFHWLPALLTKLPPWLLKHLNSHIEIFIRFVEVTSSDIFY